MVARSYRKTRRPTSNRRRVTRRAPKRTSGTKTFKGKLTDNTVYSYKRSQQLAVMFSSVFPSISSGAYTFSLSNVPDSTDFTNLYDSYKITGVLLRMMPRVTENSNQANDFGTIMYVTDYDDSTAPATQLELLERQSTKIRTGNRAGIWKYFLRPKAQMLLTSSGQAQMKGGWIDTSTPSVPHYGFKWLWTNATVVQNCDVYVTYYLKFKGVK